MKNRKTIYGPLIFLFFVSCNYIREQKIPDGVEVLKEVDLCSPQLYRIKIYELKNSSLIRDWQEVLTCEGYSNRPMNQPWTSFTNLSERRREEIWNMLNYFQKTDSKCSLLKAINLDESFFAACISEQFFEAQNKIETKFHTMYFLNNDKSILYSIEDLH